MHNQHWLDDNFPIIGRASSDPEQWLVLTPATAHEDLPRIAQALHSTGRTLPDVVSVILEHWSEEGANLLLHTLPRLMNPSVPASVLNGTGRSMEEIFPQFCLMLQNTEELAIIVNMAEQDEILIAGIAGNVPDDSRQWAYFLPKSLEELAKSEIQTGTRLSPQLKQMYSRAHGALDVSVCPYFCRPQELVPGFLFMEIYQDLVASLHLSAETVERLRNFVVLSDNATGDSQGFFVDKRDTEEYIIFQWNHESADFTWWAADFAEAVTRQLLGRW